MTYKEFAEKVLDVLEDLAMEVESQELTYGEECGYSSYGLVAKVREIQTDMSQRGIHDCFC